MFIPLKLVLSEGKPVTLEIDVRNNGSENRLVSVIVEVPFELSLNAGGYVKRREQRLGKLKVGEAKKISFFIFPKPTTEPGEYEVLVRAMEHMDDYNYVAKEVQKRTRLRVV